MKKNGKKILVVDDTEATRYAISRTLLADGYSVVEAANGRQALELVTSEQPDLVTLDIHLPDILGFEVCRRIKADPFTAHIPVLQVSASYVTSKDRIHGLEGGADSYLTHPFEPPVLLATIRALLRTSALTEKLRLTEERFRVALKYAPVMIYTTDADLRYTWICNPPGDLSPASFIGRRDEDIFPPDEAQRLSSLKRQVLESGTGRRVTTSIVMDDVTTSYDLTLEPMLGPRGTVTGLTVSGVDVTDRLKSQELLKLAFDEAEIANQAKTRFLSNMSHEIRTPLGIIQGFADLALEPDTEAPERNVYLATIKRNATSLTKLLGEILDLAKVEAGKTDVEVSRFSPADLIGELVSALGLQAADKGISLKSQITQPFPSVVETDSTLLRQILMNLIGNAIKFTDQGGIEIAARALPRIHATDPVVIEISIRDSGIGLTAEQQERLFQPFMQADSSTTRRFGGTGLGLDLSKKLARALKGDLALAASAPGKGSTFTLTFEAGVLSSRDFVKKTRALNEDSAPVSAAELLGMRVLIAEDSLDNQTLFSLYLRNAGAIVEVAMDGVEAVEKVRAGDFDAILMDVQMPNLDGYDATRTIRGAGCRTPIIALTAHALKEERDRALSNGFNDYLTKPLSQRLLVDTLSRLPVAQRP